MVKKVDPSVEFQDSDYLSLPKTFKIYSGDIDHRSGQKKIPMAVNTKEEKK